MEEEELKQPSSALKVEVAPMATPEKDKEDDGKVDPKRKKRKALCVKVAKQLLLNGTYMMLVGCIVISNKIDCRCSVSTRAKFDCTGNKLELRLAKTHFLLCPFAACHRPLVDPFVNRQDFA